MVNSLPRKFYKNLTLGLSKEVNTFKGEGIVFFGKTGLNKPKRFVYVKPCFKLYSLMWFPNSIYKRDKENIKSFQWEFKSYPLKKKKKKERHCR